MDVPKVNVPKVDVVDALDQTFSHASGVIIHPSATLGFIAHAPLLQPR